MVEEKACKVQEDHITEVPELRSNLEKEDERKTLHEKVVLHSI